MPKQIKFYRKPKFIILLLAILAGGAGAFVYFGKEEAPSYDYVLAEKTDIIQEVSVTGRVNAEDSVDLAFEVGGKVDQIFVSVGDEVQIGDKMISLNSDTLDAQLQQAQASVSSERARLLQYQAAVKSEQAKLDELKKGYRKEEIQLAEIAVSNAKKVISDAETSLTNTKAQAEADLDNVYQDAIDALPQAVYDGKTALLDLTDIQYAHFNGYDSDENQLANAKEGAVYALLGTQNAGRYTTQSIGLLNSGVFQSAQEATSDMEQEDVEELLASSVSALRKVKSALDAVPISADLSSTEKSLLDSQKTSVNSAISTLSGKSQTITVQKATNTSSISSAETAVNTAKNSLATAQKELALKKAGYSSDQISAQEAQVEQAKANQASQNAQVNEAYANAQYYQAQIDKTMLKAPIAGIVANMEAKLGEIVMPSSSTLEVQKPLVSIISEGTFEIEADIPEVDIAKVKVGDTAAVTLDAYGSDVLFSALVMAIDPAETIVEGVSTYKTTLAFTETDERIKPGMTANIDILTAEKDDVIAIPQRAVITKDDVKTVRLLKSAADPKAPNKTIEILETAEVETGLRGSLGDVEIISGVEEGDKVVVYIKESDSK